MRSWGPLLCATGRAAGAVGQAKIPQNTETVKPTTEGKAAVQGPQMVPRRQGVHIDLLTPLLSTKETLWPQLNVQRVVGNLTLLLWSWRRGVTLLVRRQTPEHQQLFNNYRGGKELPPPKKIQPCSACYHCSTANCCPAVHNFHALWYVHLSSGFSSGATWELVWVLFWDIFNLGEPPLSHCTVKEKNINIAEAWRTQKKGV